MNDILENDFTAGSFTHIYAIYRLNLMCFVMHEICANQPLLLIADLPKPCQTLKSFSLFLVTATAVPFSHNYPTDHSCVNWNQYYTNCTQLGNNPFQGTISFDNIGLAWVAIFLVIITFLLHLLLNHRAQLSSTQIIRQSFFITFSSFFLVLLCQCNIAQSKQHQTD